MSRWLPWVALLLAIAVAGVWLGADSTATPIPAESPAAAPPASASPLPRPNRPYTLRQGRSLFLHYCATCHGEEGRGDGFNAYNLDPKPRDLADPAFHEERTDQQLEEIIRIGGGAVGMSTGMPPWGGTLGQREIGQLVAYLRVLPQERRDEEPEDR